MRSMREIRERVQTLAPLNIAIAGISAEELLLAKQAKEQNIADFTLIDHRGKIESLIEELGLSRFTPTICHIEDVHHAPALAVEMVKKGMCDLPMKGQVHTSAFVRAILDKEKGLSAGGRLSQITMFDGYRDELQFLTDCAINISPTLEDKMAIIQNAVKVFSYFNSEIPLVALLGAVETVSKNMQDTVDSAVLTQMNRRGQIGGCIIDGPLSLDNAISEEFAKIKGIESPVAGKAQILVSSYLQEANSLSKSIIHYAKRPAASLIAGTTLPVIMTSRTDLLENKLNTIAASCFIINQKRNRKVEKS